MRDANQKPTGLVAVGRDLTERRQFETQLIRSEKLAALGVLAGGIAHEVRNPLAVVSSAAQLLLEGRLDSATRRVCEEKIHQNVQRASGVIENLLRFARQSDRGERLLLDLAAVARDAADRIANQFKLSRVELALEFPSCAVPIRGTSGLLQQPVMNLLLNAANSMPETGGRVTLRVSVHPPHAVLQVVDTGCGIPTADLPKVFDPFFTTMPVGKGTGLGLSICYSITKQHGGGIDIASEPDQETVVTVRLPLDTGPGSGEVSP
ncbi:sensor histidine kinase [Frigoriglobus tundricola]|nr:ATP-binding protein [Frigoriglobus tundricola]